MWTAGFRLDKQLHHVSHDVGVHVGKCGLLACLCLVRVLRLVPALLGCKPLWSWLLKEDGSLMQSKKAIEYTEALFRSFFAR